MFSVWYLLLELGDIALIVSFYYFDVSFAENIGSNGTVASS